MITRVFAIDGRALACFRMAMGLILLTDLWIRGGSLLEHYSDAGILSRTQWIENTQGSWRWSLHVMNGQQGFTTALFALAAAAALALTIGWRTRAATVVSWVLLASLQYRNELILNGGDTLLRVFLFWAMFLPLGKTWSVDRHQLNQLNSARPQPTDSQSVSSIASFCLILQFLIMYVFSGLFKLNDVWLQGDGLRRALSFDLYSKPLGQSLLQQEPMLQVLSKGVVWMEIVLPCLCLLPMLTRWWRWLAIVCFAALHLGIELTMTTGLFPWVCMAGWILLVPSSFFDRLTGLATRLRSRRVTPSQPSPPVEAASLQGRGIARWLGDGAMLFLLAYVLLWNICELREVQTRQPLLDARHHWLADVTGLRQKWEMFREPPMETGWYVVTGTLRDGQEINLLTGQQAEPGDDARPDNIAGQYPDHRWRKYMASVYGDGHRGHRSRVAGALAQRWNRMHDETNQIEWIALTFMRRTIAKPGEEATPPRKIVMHRAPAEK